MWMQILRASGLPVLGEAFPQEATPAVIEANPGGYFEGALSSGVYYATNPHPDTGHYLSPRDASGLGVKVMGPGLVRTDISFIDRVMVSVRDWRAMSRSVHRFVENTQNGVAGDAPVPLLWWIDNFGILRDAAIRGYPAHFQSYESVIANPQEVVPSVLSWLGIGTGSANSAATGVVDAALNRSTRPSFDSGYEPEDEARQIHGSAIEVLDTLYAAIHGGVGLSTRTIRQLNTFNDEVRPLVNTHREKLQASMFQLAFDAR